MATNLTFTCNPTHGTVDWTTHITGVLTDASSGAPISGAAITFEYWDGFAWQYTGVTAPNPTDVNGAYLSDFSFQSAYGWAAGMTSTMRAAFAGDGVNEASVSDSVTLTMDGGGGGGVTALSFSCAPTHGVVPWTAALSGRLTDDLGVGIPNASVQLQFWDGLAWQSGAAPYITDSSGAFSEDLTFTSANGWVAGMTGQIRVAFAGDATYTASESVSVEVTMDNAVPAPSVSLSASPTVAYTALLAGAISGGTPPYTFSVQWGDGAVSSGSGSAISLTHVYDAVGNYAIAVTVIDAGSQQTVEGTAVAVTAPKITPYAEILSDGQHTVTMPTQTTIDGTIYTFSQWENGDTNPIRTFDLSADTTLSAAYTTPTQAGFPIWAVIAGAGALIGGYALTKNGKKPRR